jgi:hypothetical protein
MLAVCYRVVKTDQSTLLHNSYLNRGVCRDFATAAHPDSEHGIENVSCLEAAVRSVKKGDSSTSPKEGCTDAC